MFKKMRIYRCDNFARKPFESWHVSVHDPNRMVLMNEIAGMPRFVEAKNLEEAFLKFKFLAAIHWNKVEPSDHD